jgi:hypothetical protein
MALVLSQPDLIAGLITSTQALSVSTAALESSKVNRSGDTMTGTLNGTGLVMTYGIVGATQAIGGVALTVSGGHVGVGLSPSTTIALDVLGLIRISSGIVSTGGNARGANAIDLQTTSTAPTNVASGGASVLGGGYSNTSAGGYGVVAGGSGNNISSAGEFSVISGGVSNNVLSSRSNIGGGTSNSIGANTSNAVIGGGSGNSLDDSSDPTKPSVICGGKGNTAANQSFIGGGQSNTASNQSSIVGGTSNACSNQYCAVGGGQSNTCSGSNCVIGGGNSNTASGLYSVVAGGLSNSASGISSYAAGRNAKATAQGSYTLSDFSSDTSFSNNSTDTYKARFAGGYQVVSSSGVTISSSVTSGVSMCFAGAHQTLPTTGWARGCFAYQLSDNTPYVSTETVTISQSWKALY